MKKNKFLSVVAIIMGVLFVIPYGGCKPSGKGGDEKTLQIYATSAGFGVEWIERLIPIFKAQNPDIEVEFDYDQGVELCRKKVIAGPNANPYDLMFSLEDWQTLILQGKNGVVGYDYALEDLSSLLDDNDKEIRNRISADLLDVLTIEVKEDGEYKDKEFVLPWAKSVSGILYNKKLFEKHADWTIPRTTDELIELCNKIKKDTNNEVSPFVNETSTGYLSYISNTTFAQYLGSSAYYDYFDPISEDDYLTYSQNGNKSRLYSSMLMDNLLNPDYGYLSSTAQEDDYGRAQGRIISGQGAMMVMGDWFDNEMSITIEQATQIGQEYQSGMMSYPVISALSDRLSYWNKIMPEGCDYQFAKSGSAESANLPYCDELLRGLVDYVNGKTTTLPSVNVSGKVVTAIESDVEIVNDAVKCYLSLSAGHTAVIPAYANAKDLAKEFLKLLYSEQGAEIFLDTTKGGSLPVNYDIEGWGGYATATAFQKDVYKIAKDGTPIQHKDSLTWRVKGLPEPRNDFFKYSKSNANYISPETYFINDSLTKNGLIEILRSAGKM